MNKVNNNKVNKNIKCVICGIYDTQLESYVQVTTYANKAVGVRACVASVAYSTNDAFSKFANHYRVDILAEISLMDGVINPNIEHIGYVSELVKIIEGK